ncbi:MAG: hypothetical protein HQK53_06455 [Oligoflexia bacterium]|nr:hypothetical protein [Oligoflexia bacterium]
MKAFYIGEKPEDSDHLLRLFLAHFPKVKLLTADSLSSAQESFMFEGPFGLLLIDVALHKDSPSEVAKRLVDLGGNRPIVFVGPKNYIETRVEESVFRYNECNQLLYRPFSVEEFKKAVSRALSWSYKEEFESSVIEVNYNDYIPVKIKNFYLFTEMPYDAYVEVATNRFIKVINKNQRYPISRITGYVHKGVKSFYLKKEDNLQFLSELLTTINEKITKINCKVGILTDEQLTELLLLQVKAVTVIHSFVLAVGVVQEVNHLCNDIIDGGSLLFDRCHSVIEILRLFPFSENNSENNGGTRNSQSASRNGEKIQVHTDSAESAMLSYYFSLGILQGLRWDSNISRRKMGLAAILHDSMVANEKLLEFNVLNDPLLAPFKDEEKLELKEHPLKAARIAQGFSGYSDVDFIIEHHHEHPDGTGFPNGLNSSDLPSMSSVFIVADRLAYEFIHKWKELKKSSSTSSVTKRKSFSPENAALRSAIKRVEIVYHRGHFKDLVKAFGKHLVENAKYHRSNEGGSEGDGISG